MVKLTELKLEQEPEEQSYTIFCDIDGVLANFKKQMNHVFQSVQSELNGVGEYSDERFANDPKFRDYMWRSVAHYQKKHGFVVWRNLELNPDAMDLWNYIKRHNPVILSATGQDRYHSAEQKRAWITEHFGSAVRTIFVTAAAQKMQYAGKNHILIDDQLRALDPWVRAGGIGIHHTSAQHTIQELKKLGVHS